MALHDLGITKKTESIVERKFNEFWKDFDSVEYTSPSDFVSQMWERYKDGGESDNRNINGKMFESLLAVLCIRENILPLFLEAKVLFVPNVIYDMILYSKEGYPICLSLKTSLRERYKQADLESIALKYVHRRAQSYLITLDVAGASGVRKKIESGDILGINDVIVATKPELDILFNQLKKMGFIKPEKKEIIIASKILDSPI